MNTQQRKLIAAVSLCTSIFAMASGAAQAATLQTYHLSTTWSLLGDIFTWTGDVTTDTGCTVCTLADLTSPVVMNQTFTSAQWNVDFANQYFYQTNPGALGSFSFSTTGSSYTAAWAFEFGNLSWFKGNNAAYCWSGVQNCYDGIETIVISDYQFTYKYSVNSTTGSYDGASSVTWTPQVAAVPLPSALPLFGAGLLGLGAMSRKGKVRNA